LFVHADNYDRVRCAWNRPRAVRGGGVRGDSYDLQSRRDVRTRHQRDESRGEHGRAAARGLLRLHQEVLDCGDGHPEQHRFQKRDRSGHATQKIEVLEVQLREQVVDRGQQHRVLLRRGQHAVGRFGGGHRHLLRRRRWGRIVGWRWRIVMRLIGRVMLRRRRHLLGRKVRDRRFVPNLVDDLLHASIGLAHSRARRSRGRWLNRRLLRKVAQHGRFPGVRRSHEHECLGLTYI
jgi:hypothetical protein